jgi:hypothetical protein
MSWYNTYNNYLDVCLDEVLKKAYTMGYSPRLYDDWVLVTKYVGLGYAGISFMGSSGTHTNGQYSYIHATAHEIGHNLGVLHSHVKAPYSEYGNTLEIMGSAYGNVNPHFAARTKLMFGWLQPYHVIQVQRTSGVYRLNCMDHPGSYGHRLIQLGYTHQKRAFWLEYRHLSGFGNIGSLTWPYPKSLIDSPLVRGAVLLEDRTDLSVIGSDSTLIDTSGFPGDQTHSTIAVGTTYVIGQEGVPTNTPYATVKVLGAGGIDQDSYLDVQLTFGGTDLCPFPKKLPLEICEHSCVYTQGYSAVSLIYFISSERAWNFVVPGNQVFTGIGAIDLYLHYGAISHTTIRIWTNSAKSQPGDLLAIAMYTNVISQNSSRIVTHGDDPLNKLQLNPGVYWLSFVAEQVGDTQPAIFFDANIADGLPSYKKSGDVWVTDGPPKEVYISLTAKCAFTLFPEARKIILRDVPSTVESNTRFYVTVMYTDASGAPAKPTAGRQVTASLLSMEGDAALSGIVTAITVDYSPSVTIPELRISAGGVYQILVTDGTLTTKSEIISVSGTITKLEHAANFRFKTLPHVIPSTMAFEPIEIENLNSAGFFDAANDDTRITVTTSSGTLSDYGKSARMVGGMAVFDSLLFVTCPSSADLSALLSFTAGQEGSHAIAGKEITTTVRVFQEPAVSLRIGSVSTKTVVQGVTLPTFTVEVLGSCRQVDTTQTSGTVTLSASCDGLTKYASAILDGVAIFTGIIFQSERESSCMITVSAVLVGDVLLQLMTTLTALRVSPVSFRTHPVKVQVTDSVTFTMTGGTMYDVTSEGDMAEIRHASSTICGDDDYLVREKKLSKTSGDTDTESAALSSLWSLGAVPKSGALQLCYYSKHSGLWKTLGTFTVGNCSNIGSCNGNAVSVAETLEGACECTCAKGWSGTLCDVSNEANNTHRHHFAVQRSGTPIRTAEYQLSFSRQLAWFNRTDFKTKMLNLLVVPLSATASIMDFKVTTVKLTSSSIQFGLVYHALTNHEDNVAEELQRTLIAPQSRAAIVSLGVVPSSLRVICTQVPQACSSGRGVLASSTNGLRCECKCSGSWYGRNCSQCPAALDATCSRCINKNFNPPTCEGSTSSATNVPPDIVLHHSVSSSKRYFVVVFMISMLVVLAVVGTIVMHQHSKNNNNRWKNRTPASVVDEVHMKCDVTPDACIVGI